MGFWRALFGHAPAASMTADQPAARFSVDVPPEMLEAMTAGGAIAPRISRNEALQVPAVMRGRNLICSTLAGLPLKIHGPDRREVDGYLLGGNIDPDVPNIVTLANTLEDMLFEGIAWWRVTRFGWHNYPVEARWVPESSVHVAQTSSLLPSQMRISPDQPFPAVGQVYIDGMEVPDSEVIRFDSPNPPLLRHAARAIRTALRLERSSAMYADSPMPQGVFEPQEGADPLNDDEIQELLTAWDTARRDNAWAYTQGVKANPLQWNPKDLQLAEARQHAVLEIARAMGIDPEDLGVSTTSRTYQNGEQRRLDLTDFTLAAYSVALQQRLSMRDITPRGYEAKLTFDGFLRSDTKTRMETYKIGREVGAYNDERIARLEDIPSARPSAPAKPTLPQPQPMQPPVEQDADAPAATFSRAFQEVDVMPYDVMKHDSCPMSQPWTVVKSGTGEKVGGCHSSRESATAQMRTIGAVTHSKARAAAELIRLYGQLGEEPPEQLRSLAASMSVDHPQLSFDDPEAYASFRVNEAKRTISGMVVPWGKIAVSRGSRWRFGENSLRWGDASRIKLNLGHDHDLSVGYAAAIRNTSKGLDVTFKVAEVPEGDRALALAAGKAWDGLSIEIDFDDMFGDDWQTDPTDESVRLVRQAKLMHVALTPSPAFDDARVAAVAASRTTAMEVPDGHQGQRHEAGPGGPRVRVRSRRVH